MNKKIHLIISAIIIISAATITLFTTIQGIKNEDVLNQARIENTTKTPPTKDLADPYTIHYMFENMSGYKLKETQKNKKITYYIYDLTDKDTNQDQDVFLPFCEKLKENGYEEIAATADGAGYINQYELLYDEMHYMIYTEYAPDKVVLSVVDYNEDV